MDVKQRDALKARINSDLDILRADIAALRDKVGPISPDNAIGRLTRMEAINAKSVDEAALNAAYVRVKKLELALARIDDEDFGVCESCGKVIPSGRLLAVPETRVCVRCAESGER